MITPMTRRIMKSAQELGFDWQPLDKLMHQDRWHPEFAFGYYGDPHGVNWTAREFVDDAVAHGGVIENRARVIRVLVENHTATGVEYRSKGRLKRASAEIVVVAAGGIGSPLILRASGIEEAGFDFFFDPLITVCGTIKDVAAQPNEIPMSTGVHLKDEGYMMTDMAVPRLFHAVFEAQVGRFDKLFSSRSTARIMVKVRDKLGGQLTRRGGVRKSLTREDREKLDHGYRNATRILQNMGARSIHKSWYAAAHPGGTVKIGHLLDDKLKTQIDNLFVCDCSVIPEEWGLPPTLTIVGLGKYLARNVLSDK
jgi:choline dehydrogenase-like flavoprotein